MSSPPKQLGAVVIAGMLIAAALPICGCVARQAISSPNPTPFVTQPSRLEHIDGLPFELIWMTPEFSTRLFSTVKISAVRSDQLDSDTWIFSAGAFVRTRENYILRTEKIAAYLQQTTAEAFRRKVSKKEAVGVRIEEGLPLQSVDEFSAPQTPLPSYEPLQRENRTLLIELSISEMSLGDPLIYGGLFAAPIPGIANLSTGVKAPALTIEAKFVDEATGEVIIELLDRRYPPIKIVDFNRLTVERSLRKIADQFAQDLARLFFANKGERLPRRWPVSLIPW